VAAALALFLDVHALASLLSIGVMTAYSAVAAACLVCRASDRRTATACLAAAAVLAAGLGLALRFGASPWAWAPLTGLLLLTCAPLARSDMAFPPFHGQAPGGAKGSESGRGTESGSGMAPFVCPWVPLVPWLALSANVGLMAQLPLAAWARLAAVTLAVVAAHWFSSRSEASRRGTSVTEGGHAGMPPPWKGMPHFGGLG